MNRAGLAIIANAVIWGFVIIASSQALKGTGAYQEIQHILAGSAAFSLLAFAAGVVRKPKR